MGRTAGWFPHRKPNKKEPVGFFKRGGRREYFVAALLVPLLRNGTNHGFASAPKAKQKRALRLLENRAPAQMRSRCAGRGGAGLWVKPRGTKRRTLRPCADAVLPLGILRANRRMRFAGRCSALVPLLRNGANRGFVSAPKAKQKRACRLCFVWYSRWESNPERPLRSCGFCLKAA